MHSVHFASMRKAPFLGAPSPSRWATVRWSRYAHFSIAPALAEVQARVTLKFPDKTDARVAAVVVCDLVRPSDVLGRQGGINHCLRVPDRRSTRLLMAPLWAWQPLPSECSLGRGGCLRS